MNSGTEVQVEDRVREHLQVGEAFRAAVWVSRRDERASVGMTRAEMSPFRLGFRRPKLERRGVFGSPGSFAVGLDEHVRLVTDPRVLALTDRRLMVLSERFGSLRGLLRPASRALPSLHLDWECPRADLVSATEKAGHLRLTFTDKSVVTLITPSAGARSFLAG